MSEELYLRPLTEEDAAVSWRWRNDPAVWKLTISRPDIEVTEAVEREWARKVIADPARLNFAICLGKTGRYIGNAYLTEISGTTAHPGIFIGEGDCRGIGLGRLVLAALRQEAAKRGITELLAHVRTGNVASLMMVFRNGGRISGDGILDVRIPCV